MYSKYTTDALVLGSREQGESDRVYSLYTKDFGLIRARATAVRTEKSKMRYALQHYALSRVSLVKGARGWRTAGAASLRILPATSPEALAGVTAFARISSLVLRLVHGQEKNEYLFEALAEAHTAFAREPGSASGTIEIVCAARILYALGYISDEALQTALFTHTAYTGESLLEAESLKDKLLLSINKAIAETQL